MAEIEIMTDAAADLSAELTEEMGITVLPMTVDMNGKSFTFSPKETEISIPEFYQRMIQGEVARTSQVNVAVFHQYFEAVVKEGRDVLYIGLSSGLTSGMEAARLCANKLMEQYPQRRIVCVDSLCASAGEGLLVYTTARKKQQGFSLDQLEHWLSENIQCLCHWVTVDDLSYLQRGGRISAAAATVGTVLNIKPIIYVNEEGKLISVNKVRGRKKSLDALLEVMERKKTGGSEESVFIGYGTDLDSANYLRNAIIEKIGMQDVRLLPIGPVIGAHAGPSVIALFFFGDKR